LLVSNKAFPNSDFLHWEQGVTMWDIQVGAITRADGEWDDYL